MIVLFTDGIQSIPPYQEGLIETGKTLDSENIKVFGVLTGEQKNMDGLLSLCTNDGFIFEPDFLQELIKVMNHETQYYCWGMFYYCGTDLHPVENFRLLQKKIKSKKMEDMIYLNAY